MYLDAKNITELYQNSYQKSLKISFRKGTFLQNFNK